MVVYGYKNFDLSDMSNMGDLTSMTDFGLSGILVLDELISDKSVTSLNTLINSSL